MMEREPDRPSLECVRLRKATRGHLVSLGVDASRITVVSYGEERPLCTERTEACWAEPPGTLPGQAVTPMYPVLLDLGFYQLRSYGVFVAVAILAGIWFAAREARRKELDPAVVTDGAFGIVLAGLVGARLYYILFSEPGRYLAQPLEILAVWHGGLSVHGSLLGGLLAGVWYVRRRALPLWKFADVVAPGLILGQTVGQIACLLNGDTYGRPTTLPWAITFTDPRAMGPVGVPLHPIQVYELLAYAVVFLVVWPVARRGPRDGAVILTYAVAYGIARFAVEFFRGDPPVVAGIIVPQAISALLVAAAISAWWLRRSAFADGGMVRER